jgi:hypothetical protein
LGIKDDEQPFIQEKPFRWVRGYHVVANHYYGQDKHSAGVIMILKASKRWLCC